MEYRIKSHLRTIRHSCCIGFALRPNVVEDTGTTPNPQATPAELAWQSITRTDSSAPVEKA